MRSGPRLSAGANWDEEVVVAGECVARSDGLWQPPADPRVCALIPMRTSFW